MLHSVKMQIAYCVRYPEHCWDPTKQFQPAATKGPLLPNPFMVDNHSWYGRNMLSVEIYGFLCTTSKIEVGRALREETIPWSLLLEKSNDEYLSSITA